MGEVKLVRFATALSLVPALGAPARMASAAETRKPTPSHSTSSGELRWLGVSAVAPYLKRVVSKPSGETGTLGDFHGVIRGGFDVPVLTTSPPVVLSTSLGLSIPFVAGPTNPTSEDDAVTKRLYFVETGPALRLGDGAGVVLGLGVGISLTTYTPNGGSGRTANLNNGTSTQNFGLPENGRTVTQFFLKPRLSFELGIGETRAGLLLETLVYAPLSSTRRSVAAAGGLYVGF